MYRSILVPLDGSSLAEHAVAPAGDIARRLGAELVLAVVHPGGPSEDAPISGTKQDRELRESEASYLAGLRERVAATFRVTADVALVGGEVAAALAELARRRRVDLIVAGTHGRGAISRLLRGGHALRLAHRVACPALLLKPERKSPEALAPEGVHRILVPLDGTPAAEASLEPALALAASRQVAVQLLQVLPLAEDVPASLERWEQAQQYLAEVAGGLERDRGLRVEHRMVSRSNVADAIVHVARDWEADMVAITTRPRGEGSRVLLGSVADRVVQASPVPVLVCHVVAPTAEQGAQALEGAGALRTKS